MTAASPHPDHLRSRREPEDRAASRNAKAAAESAARQAQVAAVRDEVERQRAEAEAEAKAHAEAKAAAEAGASPGGSWSYIEDRGSVTANHMDHPHVNHRSRPAGGGLDPTKVFRRTAAARTSRYPDVTNYPPS